MGKGPYLTHFVNVVRERPKLAPSAEQGYDLIKYDCHFSLLSLCPQDWKITGRAREHD